MTSFSFLLNSFFTFNENDIANIIYKYGEERFAKSIAKNIARQRKTKFIESTFELALIIRKSIKIHPKKKIRKNPATKTFQALRIYINNELEEILIHIYEKNKNKDLTVSRHMVAYA